MEVKVVKCCRAEFAQLKRHLCDLPNWRQKRNHGQEGISVYLGPRHNRDKTCASNFSHLLVEIRRSRCTSWASFLPVCSDYTPKH